MQNDKDKAQPVWISISYKIYIHDIYILSKSKRLPAKSAVNQMLTMAGFHNIQINKKVLNIIINHSNQYIYYQL